MPIRRKKKWTLGALWHPSGQTPCQRSKNTVWGQGEPRSGRGDRANPFSDKRKRLAKGETSGRKMKVADIFALVKGSKRARDVKVVHVQSGFVSLGGTAARAMNSTVEKQEE